MIIVRELDADVLTAARQRIRNVFSNGLPVYMSFSGGKDSLTLADITLKMAEVGDIDIRQLRVEFIDEEAIFPCVERIVHAWRERFLMAGSRFDWYCIEVRHYSCLNQLENDESFICWDSRKRETWIREQPPFAIRNHPKLRPRLDAYQNFLSRLTDGHHMTGLRAWESIQRRAAIARIRLRHDITNRPTIEPLYDWQDDDVWRYLYENDIEIPDVYMHLYQIGVTRPRLRVSQFFSIDTAFSLARMAEYYPDLMERILRREPSAYIVSLYWDSEMFRRRTTKRKATEQDDDVCYRNKVLEMLSNIPGNFRSRHSREIAEEYRSRLIKSEAYLTEYHYRIMYDALIAGDPKSRTLRSIYTKIYQDAARKHVRHSRPVIIRTGEQGADCPPGKTVGE
jgi:predicted phosphoadenosine phosphosulfate sulfurtransferase